jgi:hypothetical protein
MERDHDPVNFIQLMQFFFIFPVDFLYLLCENQQQMKTTLLITARSILYLRITTTAVFLFLLFCGLESSSQTTVSSGTTLKVSSGTTVTSNEDFGLGSGGHLDVQGTLILKKNLENGNTSPDGLGTGTIEFSGTTAQTISGQNIIANLTMNNAAGLSVLGNTEVTGVLTLTNGVISLGTSNLTLGPAATVSGTPSATKMIAPEGTGELRKEYSATGSFLFPVGDVSSTAEYSPVTLNFTSGTFGTDAYAGVKLTDTKYPDDSITGSYLDRYWALSQSGITTFNCNATFQYATSDVQGTEGSIYCVKVNPDPWVTYTVANTGTHQLSATGLSSFSTFTGAMGGHDVSLTAFLEGPFSSGSMNTTLYDDDLLPTSQPYSGDPWNYAGTESVTTIPAGVVDWVLIELRQADQPANATSSTIVKTRATFMKSDGTLVELDGTSPVRFYGANITQNLYPVIKHRNHLAIMASAGITKTSGIYTYNFTDAGSKTYGYPSGIKQVGSYWCMIGGNGNPDAEINTDDLSFYWNVEFGNVGLYGGDFNMDSSVDTDDISFIWNPNFGQSGSISDGKRRGLFSTVP